MTRVERLAILAAVTAAAAAVPVLGSAAGPAIHDHYNFTTPPIPTRICDVEGTSYEEGVGTVRSETDGSMLTTLHETTVFTAAATGEVLYMSESFVDRGVLTDNGDGTGNVSEHVAGLQVQLRPAHGGMLKGSDGEPLRSTGTVDTNVTFDASTGEILSSTVTVHGPAETTDFCAAVDAYFAS